MKIIFLIISGFFSFFTARASVDSLWKEYIESRNPQKIAPYILENYANTENGTKIDSAFRTLLGNESSKNYEELFLLYKSYFSHSIFINKKFSIDKAEAWVKLTENQKDINQAYLAYRNLTKVLLSFDEKKEACKSAEKEYHFAGLADNKTFKIEALFDRAKCFENENNKSQAFKSYLDAYYFSLEIKNKALIQQSIQLISDFFVSNKLYTKAQKYKKQELALFLRNNRNCDSNKYYALLSELSDNYFDNNEVQEAVLYSNRVLNYCIRKGNRALLIKQLAVIRSNYFENNNFSGLLELYRERFPAELDSLKKQNEVAYYRIRSLIFERNGQLGTAISYLDSAEEKLNNSSKDALMRSNFYNRKGEFFLRQNMPGEAVESLLKSYEISYQEKYYPFLKLIAHNLDSAFEQLGDYKNAHFYRGLSIAYNDSLKQMINNDEIVLLEVENLEKQKELLIIQHEEQIARKHNLQYMLIVILIASSFIILIVLGSIKIHSLVIRSLGYFVFIFFFEFIILLADNKIHHMTHGEPLKIMGLKIILIGILLPIHHWVEHKVVHYLLHHHILQNFKIWSWIKQKFLTSNKKISPVIIKAEEDGVE
jgi:hypothetical protein